MSSDSSFKSVFSKYLESRKILIADSGASSRSGLFNVFHELGAKTSQVVFANTFNQASSIIVSEKPHVVIAEYELGKRCGLELLQSQREQRPAETKDCIFLIVTGNTSQSAVAKAAEEEVDGYILKPYTPETVRKVIMQAALLKTSPSEYLKLVDVSKHLISEGMFSEAEKNLKLALALDEMPTLAFYYLGQIDHVRKILEKARGSYEQGLEYNHIHYKCLMGLYLVLTEQKNPRKAYDVAKKISQYFPAPSRLADVLRLAVETANYDDIEKYYNIFINIDDRNETLIRHVCAALVVCGKYYLRTKPGQARALELFKKAAVTAQGRTKILREIIFALLDYELSKEAQFFLARFPPESSETDEYLISRFLVNAAVDTANHSAIIDQGRTLLGRGIVDERLFLTLIRKAVMAKISVMGVEDIMNRASTAFPDKKALFETTLQKAKQAAEH